MEQKISFSERLKTEQKPEKAPGYGPHLTIDGYQCDKEKLSDMMRVFKVLDELPGIIGMTKIITPYVIPYIGLKPEDWGISGFVMIAESHISVHTYPEKGFVAIDVFSCKQFDVNEAVDYLVKAFGIKDADQHVVQRAMKFPKT
jgi:S-adenosylmethionine decarboxylase